MMDPPFVILTALSASNIVADWAPDCINQRSVGLDICKYTFAMSEVPYQGNSDTPVVLMAF